MGISSLDLVAGSVWMPAALAACVILLYLRSHSYQLSHIPTVGGSSLPIVSYRRHSVRAARQRDPTGGYHDRIFKIPTPDGWMVVLSSTKLVNELVQLPDDVVSLSKFFSEYLGGAYTFGKGVYEDPFHVDILKRELTKHMGPIFPDMYDEIQEAFKDHIPVTGEWSPVPALSVATKCIARISSRVFVGLPICRNLEYLENCIAFSSAQDEIRQTLACVPHVLKPLVASCKPSIPASIACVTALLKSEIDRRKAVLQADETELPDDMLSWIIKYSKGNPARLMDRAIIIRILALIAASIHTSSLTFTHALYTLAANPEYMKPLRDEIEAVIEVEGVTKVAMTKMYKLDSFLRECTRMNTFTGISLPRLTLKPHTFSDGTYVPAGVVLVCPTWARQKDERAYADAHTFAPFRFEPPPDENADDDIKGSIPHRQFTTTDPQYIPFGHGRHACPGRFFAGNELKAMFVHVLLTYDIHTVEPGVRPADVRLGPSELPNPMAQVLFRKRRD